MRIAIVGCGYVADFYMHTLPHHPDLELVGVMDRDGSRLQEFARHYGITTIYETLDELISDPRVEVIVNLTNPHSHYEVTKAALEGGKHVYSEKPLAMKFEHAQELVKLAKEQGLYLSSAPCNVLSEAAQTVWRMLRNREVGQVYLAYAEMDDGMVHRMRYRQWASVSGAYWPWKDEFEVGCTMEHAGYYLTWLATFFGPVKRIASFSHNVVSDKQVDLPLSVISPDFSVGTMVFESGMIARLTCSIVAPHNRSLKIVGEDGVIFVEDCWDYRTTIQKHRTLIGRRVEHLPVVSSVLGYAPSKISLVDSKLASTGIMDYFRGVSEMGKAIRAKRPAPLSADFALHITELALAMQYPDEMGSPREMISTFDPMEPMGWAI